MPNEIIFDPPKIYFSNINFNYDFYKIDNSYITKTYGDANYLNISFNSFPVSMATSTYFVNGVGIGTMGNSSGLNASSLSLNGTNISNIFITSNYFNETSNQLYNHT